MEGNESQLNVEKTVLTLDEAVAYTGFSKSYMYKLTSERKIPHSKPNGKSIFFSKSQLDAWLMSRPVDTEAASEWKNVLKTVATPFFQV
jgi:excisionase family DNA binding protein